MNFFAKLHEWIDGAYVVGFVENASEVIGNPAKFKLRDIHWIDLGAHKDTWFADPFILSADEKTITLLVEEYEYSTCKGFLSEIIVDRRTYKLLNVRTILKHETHLSFPYIIKDNGVVHIVPESFKKKEVALYSFNSLGKLQQEKVLLEGKFVDTQLLQRENKWYAFTVKVTGEGLDATKRLYVYESDSLYGEFKEIQCIVNSRKEERGAGSFFEYNGRLLRPAQICEGGYGKGVVLYEMKFVNGQFVETEYARFIANPKLKYGICFHTFNVYGDLIAVDGFDYKIRITGLINPTIVKIKSILKFLRR